jgi:hypothetical protein
MIFCNVCGSRWDESSVVTCGYVPKRPSDYCPHRANPPCIQCDSESERPSESPEQTSDAATILKRRYNVSEERLEVARAEDARDRLQVEAIANAKNMDDLFAEGWDACLKYLKENE